MRAELGLPSVRGDEERGGGMMGMFALLFSLVAFLERCLDVLLTHIAHNRWLRRLNGRRRRHWQSKATHWRQVRDSIFHHLGYSSQVLEDH